MCVLDHCESTARQMLSSRYFTVDQNMTALCNPVKPWHSLHRVLQLVLHLVHTYWLWFEPKVSKLDLWLHTSSSCVGWHTSTFSPHFLSLRTPSWSFHWEHFNEASMESRWINCRPRCISKVLFQLFALTQAFERYRIKIMLYQILIMNKTHKLFTIFFLSQKDYDLKEM